MENTKSSGSHSLNLHASETDKDVSAVPRMHGSPSLAKLRKIEPFKVWPILVAAIAVSIQSVTYGLLTWFYGEFGVSPDEVGFSYTDILGRNSLQLAIATLIGLLTIVFFSILFSFLGALSGFSWLRDQRLAAWKASEEGLRASNRAKLFTYIGFGLFLLLLSVFSSKRFVVVGVVTLVLVLVAETIWAKRTGSQQQSILARIFLWKQYYSSLRLCILLISAVAIGILVPDWINAILAVSAILILNAFLPRSSDFEKSVRIIQIIRVRQFYSKWLSRIILVVVVASVPTLAFFHTDWIIEKSSLQHDVDSVYDGKAIRRNPFSPNIFRLANPRADAVLVQWLNPTVLAPFDNSSANSSNEPNRLILFGSSGGITVLFDPNKHLVYRLPSSQITMATASSSQ